MKQKQLYRLAHLLGTQTHYVNYKKTITKVNDEILLAICQSLIETSLKNETDIAQAIHSIQNEFHHKWIDDVCVVWQSLPQISINITKKLYDSPIELTITTLDQKIQFEKKIHPSSCSIKIKTDKNGQSYSKVTVPLDRSIPIGYYQLVLKIKSEVQTSFLIFSPNYNYSPSSSPNNQWGLFAPAYALHDENSWGIGSYRELYDFHQMIHTQQGPHFLGLLPLNSTYLENDPIEFSPYSPISRLFWNELYLDIPEILSSLSSPHLIQLTETAIFKERLNQLNQQSLVDYKTVFKIKKQLLMDATLSYFRDKEQTPQLLENIFSHYPHLKNYALFRATQYKKGISWKNWNERLNLGQIETHDYSQNEFLYHVFCQWQSFKQIHHLKKTLNSNESELYLDFPIGVHPDGYDVWLNQNEFVLDTSFGAPPDPCFISGQNWTFHPPHPKKQRQSGYELLRTTLNHQMKFADKLRIDHILGYHRLFWIPKGADSQSGTYVKYPAEELYAITLIESHLNQCTIIGENLGLVPQYINKNLKKYHLLGMHVLQYALPENAEQNIPEPEADCLACINTHDAPPFQAFLNHFDIKMQMQLKWINSDEKNKSIEQRKQSLSFLRKKLSEQFKSSKNEKQQDQTREFMQQAYQFLLSSHAQLVMINTEDLWLEDQFQNFPGTSNEHPNWQKKFKLNLSEISQFLSTQSFKLNRKQ